MFSELIRQFILRNKLLLGKTIFIIMGSLLTRLLTAFESCLKTEYKILILGLNAAGMKIQNQFIFFRFMTVKAYTFFLEFFYVVLSAKLFSYF